MARGQKGTGKTVPPRPAYLIYTITDDGYLNVIDVVRQAEAALEIVDNNAGAKYHRFTLK